MEPVDVDAFAGKCADALADYERGLQEQAEFEAEHADTYRRLRGEFTRDERRIMARRYTATELQLLSGRSPVLVRPQPRSRAPRSRSQRRATRNKSPSGLSGDDSDPEPPRPLDLLDAAVLTLGWERVAA